MIENYMRNPEDCTLTFYMIADGHGSHGFQISNFILENYPAILKTLINEAFTQFLRESQLEGTRGVGAK